ncbi:MAG: V-type ATPase subunit [Defluviitaleaceae bacterium]|nr:V-type ATPase subunit [Defluviitaleaceae bacterium]
MKYVAVNSKILAMRATPRGVELEKICHYLPKNARDFLKKFADGFKFYENLPRLATLDKPSRDSLRRVFITETNLRNILKIYRLKRFYNLRGDEILPYLAPVGGNAAEISRLAQTAGLDDFLREAAIGTGAAFENNFAHGEKMLAKAVRAAFKREYRHENLAVACGFLYERWGANGSEDEIHQHNGPYRGHEPRD